jgi:hypothetical protein
MQPTLTLTDAPEPHTRQAIAAPLIQFNNSRGSQPEDYRSLVIILSNSDTGEILGALCGATNFAHLHVDLLKPSNYHPVLALRDSLRSAGTFPMLEAEPKSPVEGQTSRPCTM